MKKFESKIQELHRHLDKLLTVQPITQGEFPKKMEKIGCVYLFSKKVSENEEHLYAGRTRQNIKTRYRQHTNSSSDHNSASFAMLLTKEKMSIKTPGHTRDKRTRKELMNDIAFKEEFNHQKGLIKNMLFRWIKVEDDIEQALFEIYCALELGTPYNSFRTH